MTEVWRGITFSQYSRNSFWGSIFLFYFQFLLLFIWFIFDIKKIIKYKKEFFKGGGLEEKLQLRWAYSSSRRGGVGGEGGWGESYYSKEVEGILEGVGTSTETMR